MKYIESRVWKVSENFNFCHSNISVVELNSLVQTFPGRLVHIRMITQTMSVLGTGGPLSSQVLWRFYLHLIHFSFLFQATDDAGKQSAAGNIVFLPAFHQLNGLHLSLSPPLPPLWSRGDFSLLLLLQFFLITTRRTVQMYGLSEYWAIVFMLSEMLV